MPLVRGRRILDFWTDWPRALRRATGSQHPAASMRGRKILDVTRRGKVLFLKLSGKPERSLAIHLGMSGRLEVGGAGVIKSASVRHGDKSLRSYKFVPPPLARAKRRWVHFRWRLSPRRGSAQAEGQELRLVDPRKFGLVWYGSPEDLGRDPYLGRLGRDARGLAYTDFSRTLADASGMIKPYLLRQDRLAGIGNIIADEALWRARIHPETSITHLDLPAHRRLFHGIRKTIRAMLSSGGTTLRNWGSPDGRSGHYQERRLVYGKAGSPCPRCGAILQRIVIGSRGTTLCPACQTH